VTFGCFLNHTERPRNRTPRLRELTAPAERQGCTPSVPAAGAADDKAELVIPKRRFMGAIFREIRSSVNPMYMGAETLPVQIFEDGFGAGMDAKFVIDMVDVALQRAGADMEVVRHFLVGEAPGELVQHVFFAGGETG